MAIILKIPGIRGSALALPFNTFPADLYWGVYAGNEHLSNPSNGNWAKPNHRADSVFKNRTRRLQANQPDPSETPLK